MNRLFQLAFCSILLASTVLVYAQEVSQKEEASAVKGERRALLIAVSNYESESFIKLPSTDNDVILVKEELLNSGFKAQNIRVLQHSGTAPTLKNITNAVKKFADSCESEDLAFIMLTGHGLRNKQNKDFFLPFDAEESDFKTFVPLDFVIETLEKSEAKFKWILVDACRDVNKGLKNGKGLGKLEPMPGMLIFQSSAPEEASYFTDDQKHSLFIYNFVEGLRGGAIGDDGRVSVFSAFEYARNQIEDRQHPVMSTKNIGDFVLTENKDWVRAAEHYWKARKFVKNSEYEKASREINFAIGFNSPLREEYQHEADLIERALRAPKSDNKSSIEPSIEPENIGKTDQDKKTNNVASSVSTSSQSKPTNVPTDTESDWETGKAGERRVIMVDGIEYAFCYCPAGKHTIGSPKSEKEREPFGVDETQHEVEFSHPYWMLETEVTQAMWTSVMGDNPSNFKGNDFPVERVSWNNCQEFIKKLNAKGIAPEGWIFSLPTEAEWEVAARAGSTTAFPWGDVLNGDKANCDGNYPYGTVTKGKSLVKTCAVKSYSPNAWGLYDTVGNVWEWCLDICRNYPETETIDYVGAGGSSRVSRGGSWYDYAQYCRSSNRNNFDPSYGNNYLGFRCSLVRILVRQQQGEIFLEPQLPDLVPKPSSVSTSSQSKPTNDPTDTESDWEVGKAGDRRVIMVDGIEFAFRFCPAGRHTIGSPKSEKEREPFGRDETQHDVIFSHPYWMMETEVTQEMWEKVMGDNPSYFKGSNLPVERVSWDDCQKFIKKLNAKGIAPDGWVFSLPTEAEWEVAARAGSATAFPWGDVLNGDKANCDGNYPYGTTTEGKYLEKTCAVKSYSPNAWGLYDTAGNVLEWCLDKYGDYPKTVETDYVGKSGSSRVLRGGSWRYRARYCRSAYRNANVASFWDSYWGFRCVLAFALVRQQQEQ